MVLGAVSTVPGVKAGFSTSLHQPLEVLRSVSSSGPLLVREAQRNSFRNPAAAMLHLFAIAPILFLPAHLETPPCLAPVVFQGNHPPRNLQLAHGLANSSFLSPSCLQTTLSSCTRPP